MPRTRKTGPKGQQGGDPDIIKVIDGISKEVDKNVKPLSGSTDTAKAFLEIRGVLKGVDQLETRIMTNQNPGSGGDAIRSKLHELRNTIEEVESSVLHSKEVAAANEQKKSLPSDLSGALQTGIWLVLPKNVAARAGMLFPDSSDAKMEYENSLSDIVRRTFRASKLSKETNEAMRKTLIPNIKLADSVAPD